MKEKISNHYVKHFFDVWESLKLGLGIGLGFAISTVIIVLISIALLGGTIAGMLSQMMPY